MKLKKLLSAVLSAVLVTGSAVALPIYAAEEKMTQNAGITEANHVREAAILAAVEIMEPQKENSIWANEHVTKGQFLSWALGFTSYRADDSVRMKMPWESIPGGSDFYNEYSYAYLNDWYTNDMTDEEVDPESELTVAFALRTLTGALGYATIANQGIADKTGNLSVKLMSGVTPGENNAMDLNDAIIMLYNATDINYCVLESIGADSASYKILDRVTALAENKDIYKIKGRVNATSLATIAKETADEGYIVIGEEQFKIPDSSYNSYIGKEVEGYAIMNDEDNVILYLYETRRNKEVIITGEEFVEFRQTQLKYYNEKGALKTLKLDNPIIIYNGKALQAGQYRDELFDVIDGSIRVLSVRGIYDVIVIDDYKNLVVGAIDEDSFTVYDLMSNETLKLDTDSSSNVILKTTSGAVRTVSELAKGNVITYLKSLDGDYISAVIGGSAITASVSASKTDYEGRYTSVTINSVAYEPSKEMRNLKEPTDNTKQFKFASGTEYVFYININNRIAAAEPASTLGAELGYIKGIQEDMWGYVEQIAVCGSDAVTASDAKVFKCASRVKIDGSSCSNGSKAVELLERFNKSRGENHIRMPILYSLNEAGEINSIDTPYYDSENESQNTLRCRHSKFDSEVKVKGASNWGFKNHIDGKYYLSKHGLAVVEPETEQFYFLNTIPGDMTTYKIDIFTIGDDSYVAYAAVVGVGTDTQDELEETLAIVKDKVVALNEDNESVHRVTVSVSGQDIELDVKDESEGILDNISAGDIIQYALNPKGEMTRADIVLDYSNLNSSVGMSSSGSGPASEWMNYSFRWQVGIVRDIEKDPGNSASNILSFYKDSACSDKNVETIFMRSGRVYQYTVNREKVEVADADANKIKTYKTSGNSADVVLIRTQYDVPLETYFISRH